MGAPSAASSLPGMEMLRGTTERLCAVATAVKRRRSFQSRFMMPQEGGYGEAGPVRTIMSRKSGWDFLIWEVGNARNTSKMYSPLLLCILELWLLTHGRD